MTLPTDDLAPYIKLFEGLLRRERQLAGMQDGLSRYFSEISGEYATTVRQRSEVQAALEQLLAEDVSDC